MDNHRWYQPIQSIYNKLTDDELLTLDEIKVDVSCATITDSIENKIRRGEYRLNERELIQRYIHANEPIIDLGYGIGVIACLCRNIVYDSVNIFTIERDKRRIPVIYETMELNKCNFHVCNVAYSSTESHMKTTTVGDAWLNDSDNLASIEHTSIHSVDQILTGLSINTPAQIIVGAKTNETEIVREEIDTLKSNFEVLIINTDLSKDRFNNCVSLLNKNGFVCIDSLESSYCFYNRNIG